MNFKEFNAKVNRTFKNILVLTITRLKNFKNISLAEQIAYPIAFLGCTLAFFGLIFMIFGI